MTAIDGEASSARLAGDLLALARLYAPPSPLTDPLAIIVWDNVGYLIADNRREALFNELVDRVGLSAEALVAAPLLVEQAVRGIDGLFATLDGDIHQTDSSRRISVERGRAATRPGAVKITSIPTGKRA